MNGLQAEKILNDYGGAIEYGKGIFRRQSTLPCSKGKIRYAFYVYINTIVKDRGYLPEEMRETLVMGYSLLDSFVSDNDAERLNNIYERFKSKQLDMGNPEDNKQITEYFSLFTNATFNESYVKEINEFIEECLREKK